VNQFPKRLLSWSCVVASAILIGRMDFLVVELLPRQAKLVLSLENRLTAGKR
jgi:hypothetical protein